MSSESIWRGDFPALAHLDQQGVVYLDNAATAQKPALMLEALQGYYQHGAANVHRAQHSLGEAATLAFEATRHTAARWLNAASSDEIIFTRGTTESANLLAYSLNIDWQAGDEIAISAAEHHANLLPWQQLAKRHGLKLIILPLTDAGDIDHSQAKALIGARTKLVALSALSNVLGRVQALAPLLAHARQQGAVTVVDGAQASVHQRPDVQALNCDFYLCSAHKLYGPEGVGLLYGQKDALSLLKPWHFGGEMLLETSFYDARFREAPLGFEAGTPAIGAVIAFNASLNYLLGLNSQQVATHEAALHAYLLEGLSQRKGVNLLGSPQTALACFTVNQVHSADLAHLLGEQGICVRAGHHCAMPLLERLGVKGAIRVSLALYNNQSDLERFFSALDNALELLT